MTNVTEEFDGVNGFNTSTYVVIVIQRWRVDLLSGSTWKTRNACGVAGNQRTITDGLPVDPDGVYFSRFRVRNRRPRTGLAFERIFVASGARQPNEVELAVYQVG